MEDRSLKSVLYVLPATAIGGAETRFYTIIRRMKEMRSVLLTHSVVADYFSDLGITIRSFDEYGCRSPMPFSLRETIRYAKAISDAVRIEDIDCILGIMHVGTFYAAVAKDLFRLKQPLIGTILGNISAYFDREARTPTFLEKKLLWYLLKRPSAIIVSSAGVRHDLEINFKADKRKIALIPNGIDIERVRRMSLEKTDIFDAYKGKTILTACRLNAQKDFRTLLLAFNEVRKTVESRLVIVGDGELREEIVKYAKDVNIEKDLVITGFQKNPYKFIKKADIFVLSSFFEGFGNVIVEAMALGVPVVATDCPSGPAEIIQDRINGFLVPIKNHHVMANRLLKLLTDEDLRGNITEKGRQRADCFRVEPMIEKFRKLISQF